VKTSNASSIQVAQWTNSIDLEQKVIQQATHSRPQTMAAQYLQQMYAAQQQHIILQTAALQQQQPYCSRQSPSLPSAANNTLILTPAATVAAVQSDLPSVCCSSSQLSTSQVSNLHQGQRSKVKASYTPVQSHAVVRHQLHCPPSHKGAPHQLIIQQTTAGSHRQLHPIALRLAPQDTSPSLFPLTLQPLATPTHTTTTVQSQPGDGLPVLSSSCELPTPPPPQQTVVVSSSAPPPLLCPSLLQPQLHRQPKPPTLRLGPISQASLPRLVQSPPASLQRLSLRSVQALAVQSTGVQVSEELPVAEAPNLSQTFQNLSPPQTVAVDLKMLPATLRTQTPERREEMRAERTTPPPTLSPLACSDRLCKDIQLTFTENCRLDFPCVPPLSRSVTHSSQDPSYTSCSPPPLLPSAAVRSHGQSPSATLPGSPERARPLILTHIIEGFVVREALQPFLPICPLVGVLTKLHSLVISCCTIEPAAESLVDVLQCEFCGKRGYVHTFLRSKRFCSMTCVKRFNVSCTKRLSVLKVDKASRWGHRPMGRRGRPSGRVNGGTREHFLLRQVRSNYPMVNANHDKTVCKTTQTRQQ
uniref:FCS-type domain-containing protein n=1 Tax=Oncorhynchus mykiss TaxID=8022 RepID=A0A8C7WEC5_ONCMY